MEKIVILPGDGIGQDVIEVSVPIFKALGLHFELQNGGIGWQYWVNEGNPIPKKTWELVRDSDAVLLGAITSKPANDAINELSKDIDENTKYVSPVIQLRQNLDLFANVRPIISYNKNKKFEFYIIRENTEGLYSGLDFRPIPEELVDFIKSDSNRFKDISSNNSVATIRLITEYGFDRLLKFSSEWAISHGKTNIVIADKPNVFRNSSSLIFELIQKYSKIYPQLHYKIENVDAVGMWMIKKPEKYEVIVCENQFGDILSDVGAGIMGGLGVAYSGNFGSNNLSYFEPVHGSAPKYAGLNKANPIAMFLSIAMMLEHLNYKKESSAIERAVRKAVGNTNYRTFDLLGLASLKESANYIIKQAVKFNEK
ncbi:isocitrate/isopropylmalate dehydrogenase family protein [Streptococcus mutans]|uniref:isocitrate/isopropylmalate dehydrogenase family protein n=1 Tax=Streptococcus mutans TaxID=1309 RepID=UPI00066DAA46|nr:isocitrate/isopropylmalate family dehydrogenase [Streptococcus mutans]MCY7115584.1 isocitrate/isopropylmalate family dehydrogenase [Streptococcus mutans]QIQ94525.1 isocitrate/isopropylmalate dehydrogenase family protein [Streptococcus mutans]QIR00763.1 isocitrate/isopropylmalate dehydrogenase family protein [Streptococcus mutans]QIR02414.1 isocitrate/isopropylmalate dehydrogenase family protein [Streptococcus mutans]QIR04544.1 isocitrate/isopropylmalate dehydrogenase family protein [Strepto